MTHWLVVAARRLFWRLSAVSPVVLLSLSVSLLRLSCFCLICLSHWSLLTSVNTVAPYPRPFYFPAFPVSMPVNLAALQSSLAANISEWCLCRDGNSTAD